MKCLVIGGNRFVGKRLVDLLIADGHPVDVLNRGSLPESSAGIHSLLKADRRDKIQLSNVTQNREWDCVFDFVCFNKQNALDACTVFSNKTKKYIFISSQSVYEMGADLRELAFDPDHAQLNTGAPEYGLDKRDAEIVFAKQAPWPVAMIRFPMILGTDDYTRRLNFHIDRIRKGLPIYFPKISANISFVQSMDAAKAVRSISEGDFVGPINVCSEKPVSLQQVVEWIESASAKKANLIEKSEMTEENHSPFGIDSDWWMNTDRLKHLGITLTPIPDWLPNLILNQ